MCRHLFWIAVIWALSMLGAAILAPDLLIKHHISLLCHHDPETAFLNTFTLINQWTNGGISIFDRYDSFSIFFIQLGSGIFTTANVLTAALYMICAPFLSDQAQGYQQIFVWGHHGFTILLRAVGGYLLLRSFNLHTGAIIIAVVLLNTLLSIIMFHGLLINNLYSYFPLLMYFISGFARTGRLNFLLAGALTFCLAMVDSPLVGTSYFYNVVHFFVLSTLVWVLMHRKSLKWEKPLFSFKLGAILVLCLVIALPYLIMATQLSHDFFLSNSGAHGTEGRLKYIFNRMHYFAPAGQHHSDLSALPALVNAHQSNWQMSWVFCGWAVLILAMIGLAFSKVSFKWVFGLTIVLILLLNTPLNPTSPLSAAHWINVLSNPTSFLLRSFGMTGYLMPFVIFPLVGLGLQVIWDMRPKVLSWIFLGLAMAVIVTDFIGGRHYIKLYHNEFNIIQPRMRMVEDGWKPFVLEYQNPLSMPWRYYVRSSPLPCMSPFINSNGNMYGVYYKYSSLERYQAAPSLYDPRPMAFKDMHQTVQGHNLTQYYLMQKPQWVYTVPGALPMDAVPFDFWLASGMFKSIALVNGLPDSDAAHVKDPARIPAQLPILPPVRTTYTLDATKARCKNRQGYQVCQLALPLNFPEHVATSVFTLDQNATALEVSGVPLTPVQGAIIQPMQYDINHIRKGYVTFSLQDHATGGTLKLSWDKPADIVSIEKNSHDSMGFTYHASADGWLVVHLPFDPKWRISIDGQEVPVYRVNQYFIGTPVTQGDHRIMIEYWPHSPIRIMIALSVLCVLAGLFGIVIFGLRQEKASQ